MAFGKRIGGGRRAAQRQRVEISATITGLESSGLAVLMDVSSTGAKLRGASLPAVGKDVLVRVGVVDVLASVAWSRGNQIGVAFDAPLSPYEMFELRAERSCTPFAELTPEQRVAASDWMTGLAR